MRIALYQLSRSIIKYQSPFRQYWHSTAAQMRLKRGMMPVCASCHRKKCRNFRLQWREMECHKLLLIIGLTISVPHSPSREANSHSACFQNSQSYGTRWSTIVFSTVPHWTLS
jgi:hypothetical protein